MIRTLFYILLSGLLIAQVGLTAQLVLSNVTLIDMQDANLKMNMDVVIEAQTILTIKKHNEKQYPDSTIVVNCDGKYLIPGLWDMHGHLTYYGESALPLLVAYGIVGVRDPGCDLQQVDQFRKEIFEGKRIGPTIIRSGPFIDGPKKMSPFRASFTKVVTGEMQARMAVRSLKKQKVDFIKVHSRLPRDLFFVVADEAQKQNLPLVAHTPIDITVMEASKSGTRTIEHTESLLGSSIYAEPASEWEKQVQEAFDNLNTKEGKTVYTELAANKTWFTPTLIAHFRGFSNSKSSFNRGFPNKLHEVVKDLHKAGVPLLAGSDFNFNTGPIQVGIDLHEELVLFVKAGMTPYEALLTATRNAAESHDLLNEFGTIEEGKSANVVLLDSNPLEDIENTQSIHAVIVNGKIFNYESIAKLRNNLKVE